MSITDRILEFVAAYGPKVLGAIITLAAGFIVISAVRKSLRKSFEKSKMEDTLGRFLLSMVTISLKVVLVVVVLGMVGVQAASFVAVLGAVTFAIGFALQGSLSNFAGGILIIVFRPYKVGDYISDGSHEGTVREIQILNTILNTVDNKTIIIPNGGMASAVVTNYSRAETRRVDITFGVGYGARIPEVKDALLSVAKAHPRVMDDPPPFARVSKLSDSSVDFAVRLWVKTGDYWDVYFDMNEQVKEELDRCGIPIPYPQMDVHLIGGDRD
jgi:small conductance mechanosensitive channel